jgi:hypothetical protein
MNGRVAKVLRRIGRENAKQYEAPERELVQQPGNKTTAINHPATTRGQYRMLKKAYRKGLGV